MAHNGNVHSLKFMLKQPLMISCGEDNAINIWIFDNSDGSSRLLKSRSGHAGPVTNMKFYDHMGHTILSSSLDRSLRYTSIISEQRAGELSQGSITSKARKQGCEVEQVRLPPIVHFDFEITREKEWDNIVTCHSSLGHARSWSMKSRRIGNNVLQHPCKSAVKKFAVIAKVCASGHFALVGYTSGEIEIFNLQSGLHRGSFVDSSLDQPYTNNQGQSGVHFERAHAGPVRGLEIGNADIVAVSGAADKTLKFWSFQSRTLIDTLKLEYPVRRTHLHRESCMLALALDDFRIYIYDIDTRKMVRMFSGHSGIITDITFSADARWIISSSMDSAVRVWNVPSARLIDHFSFDSPVTSLALSPTNEFLATAHLDDQALYLWSNKTLYGNVIATPLPARAPAINIDLPTSERDDGDEFEATEEADTRNEDQVDSQHFSEYESPEQLQDQLITLSLLPEARWRSLMYLDVIKSRNKPKEPPKKPKQAPFFLKTIPGLEPKFAAEDNDDDCGDDTKIRAVSQFEPESQFLIALKSFKSTDNSVPAMNYLKSMFPSHIDVEVRLLHSEFIGLTNLELFIKLLTVHLKTGRDFEMIQGLLGLFLRQHGSILINEPALVPQITELIDLCNSSWLKCEELINQSLCLIGYFKSVTV